MIQFQIILSLYTFFVFLKEYKLYRHISPGFEPPTVQRLCYCQLSHVLSLIVVEYIYDICLAIFLFWTMLINFWNFMIFPWMQSLNFWESPNNYKRQRCDNADRHLFDAGKNGLWKLDCTMNFNFAVVGHF